MIMNNEEKILSILETMQTNLESVQTELKDVKQSQAVMERELKDLNSKHIMLHINQEKFSREQAVILHDVNGLKQEQAKTNERLDKLEEGQTELKENVGFNRTVLVRMELEHGKKLSALQDGYETNYDLNKQHEPRIAKLEETVEDHTISILHIKSVI